MVRLMLVVVLVCSGTIVRAQGQPPSAPRIDVARDIEYGSVGERSLKLDIYQPKKRSADLLPVVVWIHGGGWRNGNKSSGGRLNSLVATGNYVGASVGYRLSGEAIWPAQIHDCKAAIRWIRANAAEYGIDANRIGVWGSSAGGHLVSLLGTSGDVEQLEGLCGTPGVSSRVACVVDFCGPTDMTLFKHSAADMLFGSKLADERQAEAKAASPVAHVSKDDPPILIIHGTDDRTVPIEQANLFYEKLKESEVDVTFVRIEGGGHSIGGQEVMERVVSFFNKYLRGDAIEISAEPIKSQPGRSG